MLTPADPAQQGRDCGAHEDPALPVGCTAHILAVLSINRPQIQPSKDVIVEFIKNDDFKYLRLLGALWLPRCACFVLHCGHLLRLQGCCACYLRLWGALCLNQCCARCWALLATPGPCLTSCTQLLCCSDRPAMLLPIMTKLGRE